MSLVSAAVSNLISEKLLLSGKALVNSIEYKCGLKMKKIGKVNRLNVYDKQNFREKSQKTVDFSFC